MLLLRLLLSPVEPDPRVLISHCLNFPFGSKQTRGDGGSFYMYVLTGRHPLLFQTRGVPLGIGYYCQEYSP